MLFYLYEIISLTYHIYNAIIFSKLDFLFESLPL